MYFLLALVCGAHYCCLTRYVHVLSIFRELWGGFELHCQEDLVERLVTCAHGNEPSLFRALALGLQPRLYRPGTSIISVACTTVISFCADCRLTMRCRGPCRMLLHRCTMHDTTYGRLVQLSAQHILMFKTSCVSTRNTQAF